MNWFGFAISSGASFHIWYFVRKVSSCFRFLGFFVPCDPVYVAGTSTAPDPVNVWASDTICCNPFRWFIHSFRKCPCRPALISALPDMGSVLCWSAGSFLRAAVSSPILCPGTPASLVSPKCWLHCFNSRSPQGFTWEPPPWSVVWQLSQVSKLGNCRAHTIYFPFPIGPHPSLSDVWCLQSVWFSLLLILKTYFDLYLWLFYPTLSLP